MLANWQLLAVRLAELVATAALFAAAFFAVVLPILSGAGLSTFPTIDRSHPSTVAEDVIAALTDLVTNHWTVILYLLGVALVVLTLWTMLSSLVIAGVVRVLVDAEKSAGGGQATRERLAVFSLRRWWEGARSRWWEVFAIYAGAGTVACVVILVPVAVAGGLMLLLGPSNETLVLSCLLLVACVLFAVVVGFLAMIWGQKAIVVAEARGLGATQALRQARYELRRDLGRHLLVILIMLLISGAISSAFKSFSFSFPFPGQHGAFQFALLLPLQIVAQTVSWLFGAAISHWLFASLAALTLEDSS